MTENQEPDSSQSRRPLILDAETGLPDPAPPGAKSGEDERPIDLATAIDVRREMSRIYREAKSGKRDAQDAAKLVWMLSQVGKMIEVHEIERRLTELEERQNAKLLGSPKGH